MSRLNRIAEEFLSGWRVATAVAIMGGLGLLYGALR